jgi:hypothetical protein
LTYKVAIINAVSLECGLVQGGIRNPFKEFKEELIARIKDMIKDRTEIKTVATASGYLRFYHPTSIENN